MKRHCINGWYISEFELLPTSAMMMETDPVSKMLFLAMTWLIARIYLCALFSVEISNLIYICAVVMKCVVCWTGVSISSNPSTAPTRSQSKRTHTFWKKRTLIAKEGRGRKRMMTISWQINYKDRSLQIQPLYRIFFHTVHHQVSNGCNMCWVQLEKGFSFLKRESKSLFLISYQCILFSVLWNLLYIDLTSISQKITPVCLHCCVCRFLKMKENTPWQWPPRS